MMHWIVIAHLFIATGSLLCSAAPPDSTTTPQRTVVLSNGQQITYACHFNRNALSSFRFLDSSIIALTASGSLLQFDSSTITLRRERTDNVAVTYLDVPDSSGMFISYADGQIARLTSALDVTGTRLRVPANPVWFTAITDSTHTLHVLSVSYKEDGAEGANIIFDSRSGRTLPVTVQTSSSVGTQLTSFLLADTLLWFGNDVGEFGGYIGYYNLRSGTVHQLSEHDNIYGLLRTSDGSVLAYGGLSHFGVGDSYIFRLRPEGIDTLFNAPPHNIWNDTASTQPIMPSYPVTHIIDNPVTRTLVVQAYSTIFHTDYNATFWRKDSSLLVRYKSGRRDAIGSYPAVRATSFFPDNYERILCATAFEGFITLDKAGQHNHTLPNEAEITQVQSILPYKTGPIFFPRDYSGEMPWQYNRGQWQSADTFPLPPLPDRKYCNWTDYHLTGTTDTLYSLWKSSCQRDSVFIYQYTDTMLQWPPVTGYIHFYQTFMTQDGMLWYCTPYKIRHITRAGSIHTYPVENPPPENELWQQHELYPVLLNQSGPPWYITDRYRHWLFSINYASGDTNVVARRLVPTIQEDSSICVTAGCLLNTDTLLLATNRGLLLYHSRSQSFSAFPSPVYDESIYCMIPDDEGNIWLAGRGLWRWTRNNGAIIDFRSVPELGSQPVTALALWQNKLLVALQRGLVLIVDTP
jgi:hypothetical protein